MIYGTDICIMHATAAFNRSNKSTAWHCIAYRPLLIVLAAVHLASADCKHGDAEGGRSGHSEATGCLPVTVIRLVNQICCTRADTGWPAQCRKSILGSAV